MYFVCCVFGHCAVHTTEGNTLRSINTGQRNFLPFHSGHFYSSPSSPLLIRGAPDHSMYTVSEFHAEAHMLQATAGKGLAQGPYTAARAGVEPTTLRLKAIDSTKAPPCPIFVVEEPMWMGILCGGGCFVVEVLIRWRQLRNGTW